MIEDWKKEPEEGDVTYMFSRVVERSSRMEDSLLCEVEDFGNI